MAGIYNAREIFAVGIEIEKNGRTFYLAAAAGTDDPDGKKSFEELARWEDAHVALFEKLAADLPASVGNEVFDPEDEIQRYLKAAADSHVFLVNRDMAALYRGCRDVKDALEMAMRFEKDSVVLYTSMRELVPESLGKSEVDRLIREELSHVAILQDKLSRW